MARLGPVDAPRRPRGGAGHSVASPTARPDLGLRREALEMARVLSSPARAAGRPSTYRVQMQVVMILIAGGLRGWRAPATG